jgi:two-component system OmpR family response regulator
MKVTRPSEPVLVVEDDPDSREMLVQYLQFNGFNVHEAASGAAALAVASTLRPRVILMDLEMAGLDGLETTRRIRANVSTKPAIIVAVTGRVFADDRNEAHRAGFDDFISKPFDITTLPEYLDRLLGTAGRDAAPHTPTPSLPHFGSPTPYPDKRES